MVSFIWVWIMPLMISHGKTLLKQNFQLPYSGLVVDLCLVFADHLKYLPILQFSRSVMSDSLRPHGLQHTRLPCPSPTPGAYSNSCPWCWWCHPTISSSVVPFSSSLQSFPASGSFPLSRFFASGDQSIGVSASATVFPMNIQDWFPLVLPSWISLQSKGLSRIFSQHHSSKPSILWCSAFHGCVQLPHPYMATGHNLKRKILI